MLFAQFHQVAVWPAGTTDIIEACGDRSMIVIDARIKPHSQCEIAARECIKRGYVGYSLHMGETFTRASEVKPFTTI